jgi:hypothetical protein
VLTGILPVLVTLTVAASSVEVRQEAFALIADKRATCHICLSNCDDQYNQRPAISLTTSPAHPHASVRPLPHCLTAPQCESLSACQSPQAPTEYLPGLDASPPSVPKPRRPQGAARSPCIGQKSLAARSCPGVDYRGFFIAPDFPVHSLVDRVLLAAQAFCCLRGGRCCIQGKNLTVVHRRSAFRPSLDSSIPPFLFRACPLPAGRQWVLFLQLENG